MDKVTGVVEAVGTMYNGSLKVNGKWLSNKKGFTNPAKAGDTVELTVEEWNFKGNSGLHITAVNILSGAKKEDKDVKETGSGRDFNAENRGKVRHGLTVALVPLVAQEVITVQKLKEIVEQLVPFVMGK